MPQGFETLVQVSNLSVFLIQCCSVGMGDLPLKQGIRRFDSYRWNQIVAVIQSCSVGKGPLGFEPRLGT